MELEGNPAMCLSTQRANDLLFAYRQLLQKKFGTKLEYSGMAEYLEPFNSSCITRGMAARKIDEIIAPFSKFNIDHQGELVGLR
jgi:hypothetical protein